MPRILVVDDDKIVRTLVVTKLRTAGYEVDECDGGKTAVHDLVTKPLPDLIILDLIMPEVDGNAVLSQLVPYAPPVIVMSGLMGELHPHYHGLVQILHKPFTTADLLACVNAALTGDKPPCPSPRPS